MSWEEKINNTFTITTGDGEVYTPLLKIKGEEIEFNTEGFDFIGTDGTFVERTTRVGNKYTLEFYFQGEDNIDDTQVFLNSANDKRAWTIDHPFYGKKSVQPLSIKRDDSLLNATKLTVAAWETLASKLPLETSSIEKNIQELKLLMDVETAASQSAVTIASSSAAISGVSLFEEAYSGLTTVVSEVQDFQDKVRKASGAAQRIVSDVTSYVDSVQDLINFPFIIIQDIKGKVDAMLDAFDNLFSIFTGSDELVGLYETNGATTLSQVCASCSNGTYSTRAEVLEISEQVSAAYDDYIEILDNAGFQPNTNIARILDNIIYLTLANIKELAFDAKQERTFTLLSDSNIVVLAHRFIGAGDDALTDFIKLNNISLNEFLSFKKGREVVYFV